MDPRERKQQRNQLTLGWTGQGGTVLLRKEGGVTEMRLAGSLRVN